MNPVITEFVQVKVLETATDEQLLAKADVLNDFLKNQDGYLDSELIKGIEGNTWFFIFHYISMEKVRVIAEKMRNSKEFEEFKILLVPASISVTFFNQMRKW
jgi:hypothetical protein